MSKEEIDDIVCNILINHGSDGHVDGHEVITDFIISLLNSNGYNWKQTYYFENDI